MFIRFINIILTCLLVSPVFASEAPAQSSGDKSTITLHEYSVVRVADEFESIGLEPYRGLGRGVAILVTDTLRNYVNFQLDEYSATFKWRGEQEHPFVLKGSVRSLDGKIWVDLLLEDTAAGATAETRLLFEDGGGFVAFRNAFLRWIKGLSADETLVSKDEVYVEKTDLNALNLLGLKKYDDALNATPQSYLVQTYATAFIHWEKAHTIFPKGFYALKELAHYHELQRDFAQAIEWQRKTVSFYPDRWWEYTYLMRFHRLENQFEMTRAVLDEAKAAVTFATVETAALEEDCIREFYLSAYRKSKGDIEVARSLFRQGLEMLDNYLAAIRVLRAVEHPSPRYAEHTKSIHHSLIADGLATVGFCSDSLRFAEMSFLEEEDASRVGGGLWLSASTIKCLKQQYQPETLTDQRRLFTTLLTDRREIVRFASVIALGEVGTKHQIPALLGILNTSSAPLNAAILNACVEIGSPAAAPVIRVFLGSDNEADRIIALNAVRMLQLKDMTAEVVSLIEDEDVMVSDAAVRAIMVIGDKQAIPALVRRLEIYKDYYKPERESDDELWDVYRNAWQHIPLILQAIHLIGDPAAQTAVSNLLLYDLSIKKYGWLADYNDFISDESLHTAMRRRDSVFKYLVESKQGDRWKTTDPPHGILYLAEQGDPEQYLAKLDDPNSSIEEKILSLLILGRMKAPAALDAIVKASKSEDLPALVVGRIKDAVELNATIREIQNEELSRQIRQMRDKITPGTVVRLPYGDIGILQYSAWLALCSWRESGSVRYLQELQGVLEKEFDKEELEALLEAGLLNISPEFIQLQEDIEKVEGLLGELADEEHSLLKELKIKLKKTEGILGEEEKVSFKERHEEIKERREQIIPKLMELKKPYEEGISVLDNYEKILQDINFSLNFFGEEQSLYQYYYQVYLEINKRLENPNHKNIEYLFDSLVVLMEYGSLDEEVKTTLRNLLLGESAKVSDLELLAILSLSVAGDSAGLERLAAHYSEGWASLESTEDILKRGVVKETLDVLARHILIRYGYFLPVYQRYIKTSDTETFNFLRKNLYLSDETQRLLQDAPEYVQGVGHYLKALSAREAGDYQGQLTAATLALKLFDPIETTPEYLLTLWQKAQAELKLQRAKDAVQTMNRAEDVFTNLMRQSYREYEELFEEYTSYLKGEALLSADQDREAIESFEYALKSLDEYRHEPLYAENLQRLEKLISNSLGIAMRRLGTAHLEKAREISQEAQAKDSWELDNEERGKLELARQYIGEGRTEKAQEIFEEVSLSRQKFLMRNLNVKFADPEKQAQLSDFHARQREIETLAQQIADEARRSGKEQKKSDTLINLERLKRTKQKELRRYITKLKKTHPDLALLMGTEPVELKSLQERLPENVAILQYLALDDLLVTFVITADDIEIIEQPEQRDTLQQLVEDYRAQLIGREKLSLLRETSSALYRILIAPVEEYAALEEINTLGVAPSGFLHYLPFSTLLDEGGQYLLEKYTLFGVNSTSILWVAMDHGDEESSAASLLALANPDGTLPAADQEAAAIGSFYPGSQVFHNQAATKQILQEQLPVSSMVHLATHGVLDSRDSSRSYLVMADGKLSIEDIWGLPMEGTRLTTLSACDTGVGEILSGDDMISMENAFFYAGSPSVVSTLWPVADASTAQIMEGFYAALSRGTGKAEALRQAQIGMIEGIRGEVVESVRGKKVVISGAVETPQNETSWSHPYYWAAFTLRGDWR